MYYYELTERGKIAIAVLLVILLLIIPSVFLLFTAISNVPSHSSGDNAADTSAHPPPTHAVTLPPVITESPPPYGGDNNPTEAPPVDSGGNEIPSVPPVDSGGNDTPEVPPVNSGGNDTPEVPPVDSGGNPGGQETTKPPGLGSFGGNPSEGTLSFSFSPSVQNTLNEETLSMLDKLLDSAKNTSSSILAMETPQLSLENEDVILTAVVSALVERGFSEKRVEYSSHPGEIAEGPFNVFLYFVQYNIKEPLRK